MTRRRIWVGVSGLTAEDTVARYLAPQTPDRTTAPLPPMIQSRFGAGDIGPSDFGVLPQSAEPDRGFDTAQLLDRIGVDSVPPGLADALLGDAGAETAGDAGADLGHRMYTVFYVATDGTPTRRTDGTVTITEVIDGNPTAPTPPADIQNTEFRYKVAPLRFAQTWTLDGDRLTTPSGTLDLRQVTRCQLAEMGVRRGGIIRRLDLFHPGGKLSVPVTGTGGDAQVQTHAALMEAIFDRLAARDATLPLLMGEAGAVRWSMFLAGLFALVGGVGLGLAVLAGSARGGTEVLTPLVVLIAFGLILSVRYRPWRALPQLDVSSGQVLARALQR